MNSIERYRQILKEIAAFATQCGRDPREIEVVVVSKFHPWVDLKPFYEEGQRVFGESRQQELLNKEGDAPDDVIWHFIGPLQKNKVRKVLAKCRLIHSVDSFELAAKISQCSQEMGICTHILLQINTSGEKSKQGLSVDDCLQQCEQFRSLHHLSIDGLMTMAPLTNDSLVIRESFQKLRLLRQELQKRFGSNSFSHLSMGMSRDYPLAIAEGATLLRIGSAFFQSPSL
ncbi:MAG: YggS family pyridoxal phosphate-dependent enzyme [Parachlamydiaceae bacterium]